MRKLSIYILGFLLLSTSCATTKYQRDLKRKDKDCDCKKQNKKSRKTYKMKN